MTTFKQGQSVTTTQASVVVDAGLPVGRHRFRLVVFDTAGNASKLQEVVVQITSPVVPTPVPRPTPVPTPVPRPVGVKPAKPARPAKPAAPRKTRSKT